MQWILIKTYTVTSAAAQIRKTGNTGSFTSGFTTPATAPKTDTSGQVTLYVKIDQNARHTTWQP